MFGHNPYYHRSIRKYVTLFGNLFNDVTLVRHDSNMVEKERQKVPISYAPKEKFIQRLQSDPTLTKSVATTVPRFSFEMMSMQYDSARKQQSTIRHMVTPAVGATGANAGYVGVPYTFEFNLSLYVRNIEDGLQIVEQVLPFFTPDYTVTAVVSQELNITKDIPIILKSVTEKVDYEGAFADGTRMITWDFEFTLKGWLFGPVDTSKIIMGVSANIANANAVVTGGIVVNLYDDINNKVIQKVIVTGGNLSYKIPEIVTIPARRLSGKVYNWSNTTNTLYLSNMTGVLKANDVIFGVDTGARWNVQTVEVANANDAMIWIYQNPITANQDSDYGYTTFINEYPTI